jgi:hypothetical protein
MGRRVREDGEVDNWRQKKWRTIWRRIERYNLRFRKSIRGTDETRRLPWQSNWPGHIRERKTSIERPMIPEQEPLLRPFICRLR